MNRNRFSLPLHHKQDVMRVWAAAQQISSKLGSALRLAPHLQRDSDADGAPRQMRKHSGAFDPRNNNIAQPKPQLCTTESNAGRDAQQGRPPYSRMALPSPPALEFSVSKEKGAPGFFRG